VVVTVVNQGGIHDYQLGERQYRVLVVTSDRHNNETGRPFVVPLRRRATDAPPYLIAMSDQDPIGGTADLGRLIRVDAAALGAELGLITGATLERVRDAIYTLFGP
jgi:mRNA interferase MazF